MSTTDRPILDIYQMSLDTGMSENDIRWNLDIDRLVLVTSDPDKRLTTARQARNAYHNLKWFFENKSSAHSGAESKTLMDSLCNRWKELSLDDLTSATTRDEAVAAFNDAHPDVRKSKVAITRLTKFYKLEPSADT